MALLFDSWLVELLAVLTTFIAGVYVYFKFKFQYWKKRGIPYPEPSFPFGNVTNMALIRTSIGAEFKSIYDKMDGHKIVGMFQLCSPALVIRDPEMVKLFLVKDFSHFHDHGFYSDEKSDPLSAHLFSMEGTKWKHLRYKLIPTFTSGKMKMMYPTLVTCGKELQQHVAEMAASSTSLEVKDVLAKYSTDVIATCAFGIQSNTLKNPDSEFRRMGRKIFDLSLIESVQALINALAPKLAAIFKFPSVPKDVSKFFIDVVQETINFRENNNVSRNDFMQLLIKIKNKKSITEENDDTESTPSGTEKSDNYYDKNGMTVNEVAAQAFVFFVAGFETSSTTMSFCLHELAVNQDVQERLREEIDSVIADHGGELTYEAIMEMTYLDNVVSETLRKYPPVPSLIRNCTKDYELAGYNTIIEKGTTIIVPVLALHYDPQYYPEPEKFNPDRFTEEAKSQRHHYAYLPFGEGPRICIGSRFGLMQTKVGLVSLISKYQFNVCKRTTAIPLVMDPKSFIMAAIGGINLQICDRK